MAKDSNKIILNYALIGKISDIRIKTAIDTINEIEVSDVINANKKYLEKYSDVLSDDKEVESYVNKIKREKISRLIYLHKIMTSTKDSKNIDIKDREEYLTILFVDVDESGLEEKIAKSLEYKIKNESKDLNYLIKKIKEKNKKDTEDINNQLDKMNEERKNEDNELLQYHHEKKIEEKSKILASLLSPDKFISKKMRESSLGKAMTSFKKASQEKKEKFKKSIIRKSELIQIFRKSELFYKPLVNAIKESTAGRATKKIKDKTLSIFKFISSNKLTQAIIKSPLFRYISDLFSPMKFFKFLLSPVGLTLLMILGAFIKVKLWGPYIKPIINFVKDTWNNIVSPALSWFWDTLKTAWDTWLGPSIKWIWNIFKNSWDYMSTNIPIWWDNAKNMISNIWKNVVDKTKEFINGILDPIKPYLEIIKNIVTDAWTHYFKPIWENNIWPFLKKIIDPITKLIEDMYEYLLDLLAKFKLADNRETRQKKKVNEKWTKASQDVKEFTKNRVAQGGNYMTYDELVNFYKEQGFDEDYIKERLKSSKRILDLKEKNKQPNLSSALANNSNLKSTLNSYKSEEDKKELIEYINKSNAKSAEDINKVIAQFEGRKNLSIINNNNSKNSMIHVEPEPIRESMLGLSPSSSFAY